MYLVTNLYELDTTACKLGGIGPAAHDRGLDSWSGHSCVIWTRCLHLCTPVTKQSNLAKWR